MTQIIRLSRKLYYCNKIENNKDNNQSLWLMTFWGRKKDTPNNIKFNDNGHHIDQNDVAEAFNKYFTNIGSNLASKIINEINDLF